MIVSSPTDYVSVRRDGGCIRAKAVSPPAWAPHRSIPESRVERWVAKSDADKSLYERRRDLQAEAMAAIVELGKPEGLKPWLLLDERMDAAVSIRLGGAKLETLTVRLPGAVRAMSRASAEEKAAEWNEALDPDQRASGMVAHVRHEREVWQHILVRSKRALRRLETVH